VAGTPLSLAKLRRDRATIWLWLPIGGLAMALAIQAWQRFAGDPPPALYKTLYVLWICVTFGLIWRHSSQRCPKCDHRYLRAFPWMSLKKVQCGVCGYELK
jgi:hypothetical protein